MSCGHVHPGILFRFAAGSDGGATDKRRWKALWWVSDHERSAADWEHRRRAFRPKAVSGSSAARKQTCESGLEVSTAPYTLSLGRYQNNKRCFWSLRCQRPNQRASVALSRLATEPGFDFVRIFDGGGLNAGKQLAQLSGSLPEHKVYTATGPSMVVFFSSDTTGHGDGFEARFSCTPACEADEYEGLSSGRCHTCRQCTNGTEIETQTCSAYADRKCVPWGCATCHELLHRHNCSVEHRADIHWDPPANANSSNASNATTTVNSTRGPTRTTMQSRPSASPGTTPNSTTITAPPTAAPVTTRPTASPSSLPTGVPTMHPTAALTASPTTAPTAADTDAPTLQCGPCLAGYMVSSLGSMVCTPERNWVRSHDRSPQKIYKPGSALVLYIALRFGPHFVSKTE